MEIKHDDKLKEGEEACFQVNIFLDVKCLHDDAKYAPRLLFSILMCLVRDD